MDHVPQLFDFIPPSRLADRNRRLPTAQRQSPNGGSGSFPRGAARITSRVSSPTVLPFLSQCHVPNNVSTSRFRRDGGSFSPKCRWNYTLLYLPCVNHSRFHNLEGTPTRQIALTDCYSQRKQRFQSATSRRETTLWHRHQLHSELKKCTPIYPLALVYSSRQRALADCFA